MCSIMRMHKTYVGLTMIVCLYTAVTAELSCYQCKSDVDPKCITNFEALSKVCPQESTICFTRSNSTTGVVERDCGTNQTQCTTTEKCFSCPDSDCNNNNVCVACNSQNDPDCSQTDASKAAFNEVCEKSDTQCFMKVNNEKQVERGCAVTNEQANCSGDTCKLCKDAHCNIGVFPADRRRCFQCKLEDPNCRTISDSTTALPCRLYDENDKCYTYGESDLKMQRGCLSDANKNCGGSECFTCDVDNCNSKAYKTSAMLKCIKCESTPEQDKCKWGQDAAAATDCADVLYNEQALCYTQTKEEVVKRGCINERDANLGECTENTNCTTCNANGCNSKDLNDFTCIRCRSDIDSNCRNNANTLTGSTCRNPVLESATKCYYGVWNDVVIRSCLVDADEATILTCQTAGNSNNCKICTGKDCNTARSAASNLAQQRFAMCALWMLAVGMVFRFN